jgi:hypothetical protein
MLASLNILVEGVTGIFQFKTGKVRSLKKSCIKSITFLGKGAFNMLRNHFPYILNLIKALCVRKWTGERTLVPFTVSTDHLLEHSLEICEAGVDIMKA